VAANCKNATYISSRFEEIFVFEEGHSSLKLINYLFVSITEGGGRIQGLDTRLGVGENGVCIPVGARDLLLSRFVHRSLGCHRGSAPVGTRFISGR
jgi:hypothetical protein